LERCDQQTLIATRLVARHRAERIAAKPIGHQPFARFRGAQIAADIATEFNLSGQVRIGTIRWTLHKGIMRLSMEFGPEEN
jgi:hypothetical protein